MTIVDMGGTGQKDQYWVTVNVDSDGQYGSPPDIVADVTARAAQLDTHFEPGSLDAIRAAHTLEHLPITQVLPTLAYWRTFLKPGGELIIVLPDIAAPMREYLAGRMPMELLAALLYIPPRLSELPDWMFHHYGYDAASATALLTKAGYVDIHPGDDRHWPPSWTLDKRHFEEFGYTGLVERYEMPNLRLVANNP